LFLPALAFSAIPFLEASFCERPGPIRRVIFQCPIWEAGEKGVLLATKKHSVGSPNDKRDKKNGQKVLYKHINSGALGT